MNIKHTLCLIVMLIANPAMEIAGLADEVLMRDSFKSSSWRAANTSDYAKSESQILKLSDNRTYLYARMIKPIGDRGNRGAKYRFSIEARGTGPIKMGIYNYGEKTSQLWGDSIQLTDDFKSYSFECSLPEKARQFTPVIQGAGEYRNATLTHIFDPEYTLVAAPPYQMTSTPPGLITFTLYHQGKKVDGTRIVESGQDAYDPISGATAYAWIERADTTAFDAVARDIKLEESVNILYLGDSLTFFDKGNNHVDKVGYFLNKYSPDKADVWNYAAGGDDIERIVKRLSGEGKGKYKDWYHDLWKRNYDWAFVFLGHNDTKASSINNYAEPVIPPDKQRALYEELIAKLKDKGIERIILISPTSSNYELCKANSDKNEAVHNRFGEPKHLEAFAGVLQELAQEYHLEYMDVYTPMRKLSTKNELVNATDGVHLTAKGHDFIALETLRYLSRRQKKGFNE